MNSLARQRCFNHVTREAVARCPTCGQTYCRECIVDHDDRIICASCLRTLISAAPPARSSSFAWLLNPLQILAGLFLVWLFFYGLGVGLLSFSTSTHETEIWNQPWLERR